MTNFNRCTLALPEVRNNNNTSFMGSQRPPLRISSPELARRHAMAQHPANGSARKAVSEAAYWLGRVDRYARRVGMTVGVGLLMALVLIVFVPLAPRGLFFLAALSVAAFGLAACSILLVVFLRDLQASRDFLKAELGCSVADFGGVR
ncbi:MAG: hypothetical protein ABF532_09350 [Bifidobacterium sp.]|jgi:hypothetical protein|uniref:hypothetical protein n=1 Tax=Bifidobacterium sp. TaxID=41200 RepID=UPI0039EBAAA6